MTFRISTLLLSALLCLNAQSSIESEALIELMQKNWNQIEDYEVDIRISLKIPGFRMPSRKIHYLYKAPDKSKIEVKGFAVVPKQGIQPFFSFLSDSVDLPQGRDTTWNGIPVYAIAFEDTFMNRAGRIGAFIDKQNGNVYRAWASNDKVRFFDLSNEFEEFDGIYMPIRTHIDMKFPPDFKNLQRLGKKPDEMKSFEATMTDEWLDGSIDITFKKYRINRGIPDEKFEDKKGQKSRN